jgi:predicted enzyme related to lactoylglutathione lyase
MGCSWDMSVRVAVPRGTGFIGGLLRAGLSSRFDCRFLSRTVADVTDLGALEQAFAEADAIVHMAANASVAARMAGSLLTVWIRWTRTCRHGGIMRLNSILIGSENPQALVDYYTKLFGEPSWNDDGYTGWQIGTGSVTVGAHDQVKGTNASPGRIIWNIETADVRGNFERLNAAGAIVIREPYGFEGAEGLIATLADPDDNYFQLNSPMEPEPKS